ncbi:diacylglycerol kinase family protein [Lacticigenium naphthae]|uniref:diacylglycerol kinase family protein n=1 Tax=Lacticigenium naphthae TaxID=515351 RepID=UPI000485BCA7|nr:diacylglycerol kinase family protein [Lacticigenium naphthae]
MVLKENKKDTQKSHTYLQSFHYAFKGVQTVFSEERNMRTHLSLGFIILILGFLFDISYMEWLWVTFSIFFVLIMEITNTVIENLVDLVTNYEFHPLAKKVKDMAAASVLLSASLSVVIGCIIFLPKVLLFFEHIIN